MTQKLFYKDAYLKTFEARVVASEKKDNHYHLVLSQTGFYPEGGGQASDKGTINDLELVDVYEEKGIIYHVLKEAIPADSIISGQIDWDFRYNQMQQHLGQHIVSATCVNLYDAHTVGLRIGQSSVHIDVDKKLTEKQVLEIERVANQAIRDKLIVEGLFPSHEEIVEKSKRKLPETDEAIRIVKIGSIDFIPCCGLHPQETSEVSVIKIIRLEKQKNGSRLIFHSGERALNYLMEQSLSLSTLSKILGCAENEVGDRVIKLNDKVKDLQKMNKSFERKLLTNDLDRLLVGAQKYGAYTIVSELFDHMSIGYIKELSAKITEKPGHIALLGTQNDQSVQFVFGRHKKEVPELDMSAVFKKSIELIDGKGGGNPVSAQGSGYKLSMGTQAMEKAVAYTIQLINQL